MKKMCCYITFAPLLSPSTWPPPPIDQQTRTESLFCTKLCSRGKGHSKAHEGQGCSLSGLRTYQERRETVFAAQGGEGPGKEAGGSLARAPSLAWSGGRAAPPASGSSPMSLWEAGPPSEFHTGPWSGWICYHAGSHLAQITDCSQCARDFSDANRGTQARRVVGENAKLGKEELDTLQHPPGSGGGVFSTCSSLQPPSGLDKAGCGARPHLVGSGPGYPPHPPQSTLGHLDHSYKEPSQPHFIESVIHLVEYNNKLFVLKISKGETHT